MYFRKSSSRDAGASKSFLLPKFGADGVQVASFTIFMANIPGFNGFTFTFAGFVRRIAHEFPYAANAYSVARAGLFVKRGAEQRHVDGGRGRAAGERHGDGCQWLLSNGGGGDYGASHGGDEHPGFAVTDDWNRADGDVDGGGYGGCSGSDPELYRDFRLAFARSDCGSDGYGAVDTSTSADGECAGCDDLSL